jgi:hypothetical protein
MSSLCISSQNLSNLGGWVARKDNNGNHEEQAEEHDGKNALSSLATSSEIDVVLDAGVCKFLQGLQRWKRNIARVSCGRNEF